MRSKHRQSTVPPTIAKLRSMSVEGVGVTCRDSRWSEQVAFDLIGLLDETLFPNIVRLRRFRCGGFGSRRAVLTPDWRGMKAPGADGM
jgi:hypothetical protein